MASIADKKIDKIRIEQNFTYRICSLSAGLRSDWRYHSQRFSDVTEEIFSQVIVRTEVTL